MKQDLCFFSFPEVFSRIRVMLCSFPELLHDQDSCCVLSQIFSHET